MLYKYEEWTDHETNDMEVHSIIVESSLYQHIKNFFGCMEFAGQSGNCVSHGMCVFWSVIYCGY